jgi:aspartyl-tRNA(Asn)/glutamyl-tRNA(Gln) amidotransferase subunit C
MTLTLEEVQHIAKLARLELSAEELARYREQLAAILEYVAQLQELDTRDIPPTTSIFAASAPLRADEARPSLAPADLMKNAPDARDGQFKIPPVFEK